MISKHTRLPTYKGYKRVCDIINENTREFSNGNNINYLKGYGLYEKLEYLSIIEVGDIALQILYSDGVYEVLGEDTFIRRTPNKMVQAKHLKVGTSTLSYFIQTELVFHKTMFIDRRTVVQIKPVIAPVYKVITNKGYHLTESGSYIYNY